MASSVFFTSENAIKAGQTFDASKLAGKSVIITGGASGLGEASLRAFVAAGAFVTFGDISDDRGHAIVSELGSDKTAFVHCDVLNWAEQVTLFKTAIAKSPSKTIDIVFANAGIFIPEDLYPSKDDPLDEPVEPKLPALKINLIGMMYTAKLTMHYLPRLPPPASGDESSRAFILCASVAGYCDLPGARHGVYTASKYGTRGLFRSLRSFMPAHGIRVSLIAPG